MKAITIKQPWASLIVHGIKNIENRTWPCPKKYLGQRVLIHSSVCYEKKFKINLTNEQMKQAFSLISEKSISGQWKFGTIIGSVEIVDCVQNHSSIWAEKEVYNWVLANPIIYNEPIENVKGKLSFWDYPGIKEVSIECPECGSIEIAVEDYTTAPFPTYLHRCNKCEHVIMESEWNITRQK
jgi:hypothetical protein